MSAERAKSQRLRKRLSQVPRKRLHAARTTLVTLGDLISAAYQVGGSEDAAEQLLSQSPLARLLDRRLAFAH